MSHLRLSFALLTLACCSCGRSPETLVKGGYDEKEMEAATARARREVDSFVSDLEAKKGSDFSVKAPIKDGGETEHFWLTDVAYRDGKFTGKIGNDPGLVSNVKLGQDWTIDKAEISDWMFMRDGKMHGNYTLRPLLKTMPDEEAEKLKAMLADP